MLVYIYIYTSKYLEYFDRIVEKWKFHRARKKKKKKKKKTV